MTPFSSTIAVGGWVKRHPPYALQIQHQQRTFRPRAAGRELVVLRLFGLGQEQVAVFRFAGEYAGQAGAADALLAGQRDQDAGVFQRLGHALVGTNLDDLAAAVELHGEAAVVGVIDGRGGEVLAVRALVVTALGLGRAQHMLHKAARPADIQVCVGGGISQQGGGIQALGGGTVIEMQLHPLGEGRGLQALDEGRALAGTGAVVQLEIGAEPVQTFGHAQDRGDADAAGEQQAASGILVQRKQVARFADQQLLTHLRLLVQGVGATAGGGVLEHADQVTPVFPGRIAQRILADQAAGQVHVDMGAGLERRQRRAVDAGQFEAADILGLVGASNDYDFDHWALLAPAVLAISSAGSGAARSWAIRRSRMRRDCTPPASIFNLSRARCGWASRLACCCSSICRSSEKILPWPSRMVAVSVWSSGLKLRAMPQKYQIEVSVSGVMKSTTMLAALSAGAAW